MFGYVRPATGQLRVCDHEAYKGLYCGLCHVLAKRYGLWARNWVNYDFTFLALLYLEDEPCFAQKRCIRHPLTPQRCACESHALERAADATVLFTVWKLHDWVQDGTRPRRIAGRLLLALTKRAYRKAAAALPEAARVAEEAMHTLWRLEREAGAQIDASADTFARMLSALAPAGDAERERVARTLLYQLGRWIYLVDACDDLERDLKQRVYNPVALRFGLSDGWTEQARQDMTVTLDHSRQSMEASLALWPEGPLRVIIENILLLGLGAREKLVLRPETSGNEEEHERPV